ncbi:MAG TPA: ROK family transcriptional regulator, partial [Chloroflexota bacterium]|nr:ROK family transcriptional regulator [Chloroflexota bacterium]
MNRLRVIEALYRYPATSKSDLANRTGLSRSTISSLVEELGRAGVVRRGTIGPFTSPAVGRPAQLLSLVHDAGFAVGLDFGHQHIKVAVCNLAGTPLIEVSSSADVDTGPKESLDLAYHLIRTAMNDAGIARDRLLGVGMGLAAPIDSATGELHANGILPRWHGVMPAAEMEARVGVRVQLENDANVGALGEKVFGVARDIDDLIYILYSAGIGAGIILGGRLHRGAT